ncbi:MAG: hypothetical protein UY85_C0075G0003 [Candidatus Peribacteria bacterium GW2011_GWB1_54_5]|nr:MAG: hypothetical protein UY85_C0075G0003 [Candidatus Peribacteria bacterium GW2011_GWB1_54_5]
MVRVRDAEEGAQPPEGPPGDLGECLAPVADFGNLQIRSIPEILCGLRAEFGRPDAECEEGHGKEREEENQ